MRYKTARQAERESKQLMRLCLVDGRVDEGRARQVVQSVIQSRRRGYLTLLGLFLRLLKLDHRQHTAEIDSAVPLRADLQTSVKNAIEGVYGLGITAHFAENPSLIGGMRVRVGSDVYDGSVRFGLAALAKSFGITTNNGRQAEA